MRPLENLSMPGFYKTYEYPVSEVFSLVPVQIEFYLDHNIIYEISRVIKQIGFPPILVKFSYVLHVSEEFPEKISNLIGDFDFAEPNLFGLSRETFSLLLYDLVEGSKQVITDPLGASYNPRTPEAQLSSIPWAKSFMLSFKYSPGDERLSEFYGILKKYGNLYERTNLGVKFDTSFSRFLVPEDLSKSETESLFNFLMGFVNEAFDLFSVNRDLTNEELFYTTISLRHGDFHSLGCAKSLLLEGNEPGSLSFWMSLHSPALLPGEMKENIRAWLARLAEGGAELLSHYSISRGEKDRLVFSFDRAKVSANANILFPLRSMIIKFESHLSGVPLKMEGLSPSGRGAMSIAHSSSILLVERGSVPKPALEDNKIEDAKSVILDPKNPGNIEKHLDLDFLYRYLGRPESVLNSMAKKNREDYEAMRGFSLILATLAGALIGVHEFGRKISRSGPCVAGRTYNPLLEDFHGELERQISQAKPPFDFISKLSRGMKENGLFLWFLYILTHRQDLFFNLIPRYDPSSESRLLSSSSWKGALEIFGKNEQALLKVLEYLKAVFCITFRTLTREGVEGSLMEHPGFFVFTPSYRALEASFLPPKVVHHAAYSEPLVSGGLKVLVSFEA